MEDSKILDLFWARNEEAIRETDAAYGRKLLSIAKRILKYRQDAEESLNDTYLKAWKVIPPHRPKYFFCVPGLYLPAFIFEQAGLEFGGQASW